MTHCAPFAASSAVERAQRRAIRVVGTALMRAAYRIDVRGLEHVPRAGPAVVVANHVSFIDFLFVGVALPRLPHFVMHHAHWRSPALRWFFDLHRVIPIAPRKEDPAMMRAALDAIDRALAAGELVMIFPEGDMTHDGALGPIRSGVERIVARRPVPVIPVGLRGLWGSFFSRAGGTEPMKGKGPRRGRSPVEVVVGPPIDPAAVDADRLAEAMRAVSSGAGRHCARSPRARASRSRDGSRARTASRAASRSEAR